MTATFTADPVAESLAFWMEKLKCPTSIEFAPYNQVFQQLLDPGSLLAQNRKGINVALVRLEDWQRSNVGSPSWEALVENLERNVADLIYAVRTAATRSADQLILALCPGSPQAMADTETRRPVSSSRGLDRC